MNEKEEEESGKERKRDRGKDVGKKYSFKRSIRMGKLRCKREFCLLKKEEKDGEVGRASERGSDEETE